MKKNVSHRTKESIHWNNLLSWPYGPHNSWDLSPCFHGRWLRWRSSVRTVAWASVWKPTAGIITSALFYLRDLWVAVASCSVEMNCSRYVLPYLIGHRVLCLISYLAINTCRGSTSYMYVLYMFLIYFIYTNFNVHSLSIMVPQWLATKQKHYVRCQNAEFQPPEPIEFKYNTQTNKPTQLCGPSFRFSQLVVCVFSRSKTLLYHRTTLKAHCTLPAKHWNGNQTKLTTSGCR